MISRNLRQAHLLEIRDENSGDHGTLSIARHVGLHLDFSSMKFSMGI